MLRGIPRAVARPRREERPVGESWSPLDSSLSIVQWRPEQTTTTATAATAQLSSAVHVNLHHGDAGLAPSNSSEDRSSRDVVAAPPVEAPRLLPSGVARAFDKDEVDDTLIYQVHYMPGIGVVDATVFAPAPASRLRGLVVNVQKDFAFLRTEPLVCVDRRFDWAAVVHANLQTGKKAKRAGDIFVYLADVDFTLAIGQRVSFRLTKFNGRTKAADLRLIGDSDWLPPEQAAAWCESRQ